MNIEDAMKHLGGLLQLGLFSALMGFAFAQVRSGFNKELLAQKDALIVTLKENLGAQEEKTTRLEAENKTLTMDHQLQLNTLNKELGEVRGLCKGLELRNKQLEDIFKGVSPDEKQYREDMRKFTQVVAQYMDNSSRRDKQTAEILATIIARLPQDTSSQAGIPVISVTPPEAKLA